LRAKLAACEGRSLLKARVATLGHARAGGASRTNPPGPPVPPTDVTADPNADGTVTIKWKGSTPYQTFFTVRRRVGNSTQWLQIGSVATKSFVDASVPPGSPTVTYALRAQRNTHVSASSDEAIVNFGGGQLMAA
jgi:hypothetical protein